MHIAYVSHDFAAEEPTHWPREQDEEFWLYAEKAGGSVTITARIPRSNPYNFLAFQYFSLVSMARSRLMNAAHLLILL